MEKPPRLLSTDSTLEESLAPSTWSIMGKVPEQEISNKKGLGWFFFFGGLDDVWGNVNFI